MREKYQICHENSYFLHFFGILKKTNFLIGTLGTKIVSGVTYILDKEFGIKEIYVYNMVRVIT